MINIYIYTFISICISKSILPQYIGVFDGAMGSTYCHLKGEDEEEGVAQEDGGIEVAHLHQGLVIGGPVVATRNGLVERQHGVADGAEIGHDEVERAFDVAVLH